MNVAVILAGGIGSRMESAKPKQFLKVAGKTILEHTVGIFEMNMKIDEIVIVSNAFYVPEVENMVLSNDWHKVKKVIRGGKERYESSLSAIQSYQNEKPNLIFHDAVRPLLSQRIINEVVTALEKHSAIDVAIPAVDTIIEVENDVIKQIPNRVKLRRGQTPQAFHYDTISKAYDLALKDLSFSTTDDCGVVHRYLPDEKVYVVNGEESNMKITYNEDTFLLDKLFQLKTINDIHLSGSLEGLKDKVLVIFGGSAGIGECILNLCARNGAIVHGFSRTLQNVDITHREQVRAALKSVYEQHSKIDFIVNTAGVLYKEPLVTMDEYKIETIINTNYLGMVNVAIESYEYLKQSKGHLLFFTSSSYTLGRAFYSLYSSTKAATVNFVQAIAQEWDQKGIKVNCIKPERTKTRMRTENFGIEPEETLLSPNHVASVAIKTLLSDFTGQVVDVKQTN